MTKQEILAYIGAMVVVAIGCVCVYLTIWFMFILFQDHNTIAELRKEVTSMQHYQFVTPPATGGTACIPQSNQACIVPLPGTFCFDQN